MKVLSSWSWHIQCPLCQTTKCMSVHWEYCKHIYQHQLRLFVFHLRVSVILAQRHNKLIACCWEHSQPWRCITFQSRTWHIDRHKQVWNNIKFSSEKKRKKIKVYIFIKRTTDLHTVKKMFLIILLSCGSSLSGVCSCRTTCSFL